MRVLIIDDEPAVAEKLARLVSLMGHQVRIALSALAAVEEIEAERLEAVIADWNLPGTMTGVQVAQYARRRWPEAATILCSGYSLEQMRSGWSDPLTGMLTFLEKPVDAAKLRRVLEVVKGSIVATGR